MSISKYAFDKEFAANKLQNLKNKNVVVEKKYRNRTIFYFVSGVAIFIMTLIYLSDVHGAIRKVCPVKLDNGTITKTYENCKR
tara:strand:- start:370 stop:618 length:249 start_codon:yes stop_codon:yes gene_type:complete